MGFMVQMQEQKGEPVVDLISDPGAESRVHFLRQNFLQAMGGESTQDDRAPCECCSEQKVGGPHKKLTIHVVFQGLFG